MCKQGHNEFPVRRLRGSCGNFTEGFGAFTRRALFKSHLFLQRFLPRGGHLGRRHALAGASFQQVNPCRSRALLVFEVEQYVLIEGEELLVPSAVLRRLLTQVAALGPLFTRDRRQKQRVSFVVADALLHFVARIGREKKVGQPEVSPQAHVHRGCA